MTPAPYEQYESAARAEANRKYRRWLVPLMIFCGLIGAAIGHLMGGGRIDGIAIGVGLGAMVGLVIQFAIRHASAGSAASERYTADWCAEHGCTMVGSFDPPNGPFANSGHRQRSTNAIQGTMNNLPTVLYNFSYWTKQSNGKGGSTETEHPYKILCVQGPKLPIASLSFGERNLFNRFRLFDKLDSAFTSQRAVELESIAFNEKFDLEIDDKADDVWIRRVFDPSTIDALVVGRQSLPDLRYYDNTYWFVENGHYKACDLDLMLVWHGHGAAGITLLARVPAG